MKLILHKSSKLGKAGDYVTVTAADASAMLADDAARYPTVAEIRKAEGLPTIEELAAKYAQAVRIDAEFFANLKARGSKFEPLKSDEIQRRDDRAARGLCVV